MDNNRYYEAVSSLTKAGSLQDITGFESSVISDEHGHTGDSDYATKVVYPVDMVAGESLPVVILEGGDGAKSNYYNNYLNNYETINNEELPRAIYVLASPYKYSLNNGEYNVIDNPYTDTKEWMKQQGVNASEIGIQAFSNGGGVGLKMALQAANEDNNNGVVLFLNDAEQGEGKGAIFDHGELKADVVSDIEQSNNLLIVGSNGMYGSLFNKLNEEYPDICYQIKGDWGDNHTLTRRTSLEHNFLLSMMNLTDKIPNQFEIVTNSKYPDLWQRIATLNKGLKNDIELDTTTIDGPIEKISVNGLITNDQNYVINYMNSIREEYNAIDCEDLELYDDPLGMAEIMKGCIDEYKQCSIKFKLAIEKITELGVYIASEHDALDESLKAEADSLK